MYVNYSLQSQVLVATLPMESAACSSSPRPGANFTLAPHHYRRASASLRPSSFVGCKHDYHGRCARDTPRSRDYTLQEEGPRMV